MKKVSHIGRLIHMTQYGILVNKVCPEEIQSEYTVKRISADEGNEN